MTIPLTGLPDEALGGAGGAGMAGGWAVSRDWPWRRLRIPLALIALIIVAGIVLAYIQPRQNRPNSYLDPAGKGLLGAQALADILGERGLPVTAVYSLADAVAAVRPTTAVSAVSATILVTSPDLLTRRQLGTLANARADLVLVQPGSAALRVLAPTVSLEGMGVGGNGPIRPGCSLPAARLAGSAELAGFSYGFSGTATACYLVGNFPTLVRLESSGRTITILGSGEPMANASLADVGNAALAVNLLSARHHVVWLTPQPTSAASAPPAGAPAAQGPTLIPWVAWLVVLQLGVATLLAVVWRGRRFGPLIAEQLPVVVRASETVEGHARLYQSRRARGQAAQALREAMLARTLPALGLPKGADATAVSQALANRSRLGLPSVEAIVYGQAPATDADLASLTRNLDDLEREVLSQ